MNIRPKQLEAVSGFVRLALLLASLLLFRCQDPLDIIPPHVQILSPLDGAKLTGNVRVVAVATDVHLKQMLAYLDDNLIYQGTTETLSFTTNIPDTLTHAIQVKATDYRGNFSLASAMVNAVSDVEISSAPTGAKVWLDGSDTGDTTDCMLRKVGTGVHSIKLAKSGYLDWEETLTVYYKQKARLVATLTANVGSIQVNSAPAGATIWLDGQRTGFLTNHLLPDVPTGQHLVRLIMSDYYDWQDTVSVLLGQLSTVNATLSVSPYPDSVIAHIPVGSGPTALAWNATNNRVYCANENNNSVSVIDGTTNRVIASVSTGQYPRALTWNETNNKVYCGGGSYSGQSITVFDGASNSYLTSIPVGVWSGTMARNSIDNRVYFASSRLYVISGTTDQVIDTFVILSSGSHPGATAWNETNNRLYALGENYGGYLTYVIDGSSTAIVDSIATGYVRALAWARTGNMIYAAEGSQVDVIDGATSRIVATITGFNSVDVIAYDETNNKVYCGSNSEEGITIVDCATNSIVKEVPTPGHKSWALVYDHTDNLIYSADSNNDEVLVIGARQ